MTQPNNTSIRIFDQIYLGLQVSPGRMATGFLVPYEENAAGKRRMQQVDSWGHSKNRVIMDNTPIAGFRVSRHLRGLGWRAEIAFVTIEDPRGFEVDITAMNLVMLTDNAIIQDGEILQECVWARDGSVNVLLPVNSAPYKEAKENTRRLNSKVPTKEIQIGDTVRTDKAVEGVYMGYMFPLLSHGARAKNMITIDKKKLHVLKVSTGNGKVEYYGIQGFKVSDVLARTDTPGTLVESEAEMGQPDTKFKNTRNRYYYPQIIGFLAKNDIKIDIEFEAVTATWIKETLANTSEGFNILYKSDNPEIPPTGKRAKADQWYYMDMYEFQSSINGGSRRYLPGHGYTNINVFNMNPLDLEVVKEKGQISFTVGEQSAFINGTDVNNFYIARAKITSSALEPASILL